MHGFICWLKILIALVLSFFFFFLGPTVWEFYEYGLILSIRHSCILCTTEWIRTLYNWFSIRISAYEMINHSISECICLVCLLLCSGPCFEIKAHIYIFVLCIFIRNEYSYQSTTPYAIRVGSWQTQGFQLLMFLAADPTCYVNYGKSS